MRRATDEKVKVTVRCPKELVRKLRLAVRSCRYQSIEEVITDFSETVLALIDRNPDFFQLRGCVSKQWEGLPVQVFNIRIPSVLRLRIYERACRHGMSVSQFLMLLLLNAYELRWDLLDPEDQPTTRKEGMLSLITF